MTAAIRHNSLFEGFTVERNVPLRRLTSFRVGGPAEHLAAPESSQELTDLIRTARGAGIPVTIMGGGSNVLVSDNGIPGLVVLLTGLKGADLIENGSTTRLQVRAGQPLSSVCRLAAEKGLAGLEWAAGIPGTVGGAVMMNAGSFGSDMAAVIAQIEILDLETLTTATLSREALKFSYRSLDLARAVVLGAELILAGGDPEAIRCAHAANLKTKKSTQPVSQASAGCFFKNPSPEKPAGWLIEQAGLKGHLYKGAMVSDLHANFIVNRHQASFRDILDLAEMITDRVAQDFNIRLEKEVKIIGN